MFTGIIEDTGIVEQVEIHGTNRTFWINSAISPELKVDQSLSHNGICLTVEEIKESRHRVTAIDETINKTNVASWKQGYKVNLERCIQMNGRIDGHIVQGHVDTTATCTSVNSKEGSTEFSFRVSEEFASLMIEKGSISINGISLTIFNVGADTFTVGIIPYTFDHTNMNLLKVDDVVNIEFDIIGKYISRIAKLNS